jgi:hypothetical protein
MDNQLFTLVVLIAAAAVVALIAMASSRYRHRRRSAELREHFGPEYDRMLEQHGDPKHAERELLLRQRRVDKLPIRPLSREQCDRFGSVWGQLQQRFVDDPTAAVAEADRVVKEVMSERGYPMGNFEQRVADLSVDHANVIQHYRAARAIAASSASGEASTEDLRQAMVHYRALFTDLLEPHPPVVTPLAEARV